MMQLSFKTDTLEFFHDGFEGRGYVKKNDETTSRVDASKIIEDDELTDLVDLLDILHDKLHDNRKKFNRLADIVLQQYT